MGDIDKNRGALIENFNSNISFFLLYCSLGYYFSVTLNNLLFFVFAFCVFGVKMIVRYTAWQESSLFQDYLKSKAPGKEFMEQYKSSLKNKIKFFIRKSVFSANFYYVVYLLSFVILGDQTWIVFVLYGGGDLAMHLFRLFLISTRKYI